MADLYDETFEEIKQTRNYELFRKLSKPMLIALCAAIVIALAFLFINNSNKKKLEQSGDNYYKLQTHYSDLASTNINEIEEMIALLSQDKNNYAALALLFKANIEKNNKNYNEAIITYEDIINTSNFARVLKEIALLEYLTLNMNMDHINNDNPDIEFVNTEALLSKLDDYLNNKPIFKHTALEMKAHIFVQLGRIDDARKAFENIINNPDSPPALVSRCKSIINII